MEAFLAAEAGRRLAPLRKLENALSSGQIKGMARGLAYRLIEAGGVMDRSSVQAEAKALSPIERRALKGLGVRLTAFSICLPGILKPEARHLAQGFVDRSWRPPADRLTLLPPGGAEPKVLSAYGFRSVGRLAVPVADLDRLDDLIRAAARQGQGSVVGPEIITQLGWNEAEMRDVLRGLNFAPTARPKPGEPTAWRRRTASKALEPAAVRPASPFAALEALREAPPAARRPRRRRRTKAAKA
jgi:ATP-dependent RNA helicase SUPV3L1/SUV3